MAKNHTEEEEESSSEEMDVSSPGNADSGSESESESVSEHEPESVTAPKKPQPQEDSSSSTEEESDSESEPEPDPKTQKPNPVVEPKKAAPNKPKSKPNASPMNKSTKRPVDDDVEAKEKESKRPKKKEKPEKEVEIPVKKTQTPNEDVKRQLFQRLWSEDDEIVILKGMIDYRSKKNADPVADLSAFHEFIKKNLHVDVTKAQLQDKIRRLKKKYENNAGKEKKGKERTFSKPHEQKGYELSKKIWGKEKNDKEEVVKVENNASGSKDNVVFVEVKEEKKSGEVEKNVEVKHNLSSISVAENIAALEKWLEENSWVLSVEKRNKMKKELAALNVAEFDLYLRKVKLIHEKGELVREAMRDSGIDI